MLDYEYTPEPAPGDLSTERVARRAANGMAKAFGVFASSMAVAGGLFVGNVLTAADESPNGGEGPIGVDGAFADPATGDGGSSVSASGGSAGTYVGKPGAASFLPGASFIKSSPAASAAAKAAGAVNKLPVLDFGTTTSATTTWTGGTGTGTTGTTTSATTTTGGGTSAGGSGTTTSTTPSGGGTSGGGSDDGDDGAESDDGAEGDDGGD